MGTHAVLSNNINFEKKEDLNQILKDYLEKLQNNNIQIEKEKIEFEEKCEGDTFKILITECTLLF